MISNKGIVRSNHRTYQFITLIVVTFISWGMVFFQGISTAIEVWSISEIFTHCFLVVPCSLYFIYQKKQQVINSPWQANYWLLPVFASTLFLQLFGSVGDIKIFMHIATFTSLPLLFWMILGNQAASVIKFPLFFMLFSIPVGEQFIPQLQVITTDLAVPLLDLSNVPIYRNGLYLDIPEGRFLVAEACSGISFLIASIVFGCFYAYISFSTLSKQLFFVCLAIFIPIIANALRVYGIILTAHLTDMEYAAGADHLIYGGVFYAIILFILIAIGEKIRDKQPSKSSEVNTYSFTENRVKSQRIVFIVIALFVLQFFWERAVDDTESNQTTKLEPTINMSILNGEVIQKQSKWQPSFNDATSRQRGFVNFEDKKVDYFIAFYDNYQAELISSLNSLYSKRWSPLSSKVVHVEGMQSHIVLTKLISADGQHRDIAHWYFLSNKVFTSQIKVKLLQTKDKLFGVDMHGGMIAFSFEALSSNDQSADDLIKFLNINAEKLNALMAFK